MTELDYSSPHANLHVIGPNGEPSSYDAKQGHATMDDKLSRKIMKLALQNSKFKHPFKTRVRKVRAPKYY